MDLTILLQFMKRPLPDFFQFKLLFTFTIQGSHSFTGNNNATSHSSQQKLFLEYFSSCLDESSTLVDLSQSLLIRNCVAVSELLLSSAAPRQQKIYSKGKYFHLYSDLFLFFTLIVINMRTHCLDLAHRRLLSSCYLFIWNHMER